MARQIGSVRSVFVATTAPASAVDPTDAAYTRVGFRTNLGLTGSADSTAIRDADGAKNDVNDANDWTNTLDANYDPTQDAGVLILRNAFLSKPKTELYVLETNVDGGAAISGDENVVYRTKINGYGESHPSGDASTQTFSLSVTVEPVWAVNA